MNDRNVHADTHPSGHPNRTAVNAENPIFGRPADPIPAVSFQQAAVVQSEKHPRETVQSPLLSETAAGYPECVPLESMTDTYEPGAHPAAISEEPVVENTDSLAQQSAEDIAAVQGTEQAQDSSSSAEDLDAVAAKEATAGDEEEDFEDIEDEDVHVVDREEDDEPQDPEPAEAPPTA